MSGPLPWIGLAALVTVLAGAAFAVVLGASRQKEPPEPYRPYVDREIEGMESQFRD